VTVTSGKQFLQSGELLASSFKKYMVRVADQSAEHLTSLGRRLRPRNYRGIAGKSDESCLSQQARGPTAVLTSGKTNNGGVMKWMVWPGERE
jgi:hypothetical protein